MDCHRFVLAPGASSDGAYKHEGEEFVHVLSGRIELVLDGHEFYDLGPGDSLYFEGEIPHYPESKSRKSSKLLVLYAIGN